MSDKWTSLWILGSFGGYRPATPVVVSLLSLLCGAMARVGRAGRPRGSLGAILRQVRAGRSQADIAVAAGISRSYLSELEHDKYGARIARHTLVGLAEALGVEAGVLLEAAGLPVESVDTSAARMDFYSFVMSEPTLTGRSARAAVLAVYDAVADVQPGPGVDVIEGGA